MTHHLKTLPEYFQTVIDGTKPFEIRNNDRGFKPGDRVILEEFEGYQDIPACPDHGQTVRRLNMTLTMSKNIFKFRKIASGSGARLIVKNFTRGAGAS